MKPKKAPSDDKIQNEMIKLSLPYISNALLKLFNFILSSGIYPTVWCDSLITPIYKSGKKDDPGNYRGICVSSNLGKIFCMIMNKRITKHFQVNKTIENCQIGFQAGNRTSDHIFTIRTLVDKYVHNTKCGKLYTCFVDFKKAFDSVWHDGLFYKLLVNGIGGKTYDIIKSMYSKTNCAIKIGQNKTRSFQYNRGVRQGCVLSPSLFNLFIDELPKNLKLFDTDPVILPNNDKLSCLMYADDLILVSLSKQGLQQSLNILQTFCSDWGMEVNKKKTKVMIFQKKIRKSQIFEFYYKKEILTMTNDYTYLGLNISSTGSFTIAEKLLKEKALRRIFALKRNINFVKLSLKSVFKIFDTIVKPILTYGAEIWGVYKNRFDFKFWEKSEIEKVHNLFCKSYLGVNKKASNIACKSELGRLPLNLEIVKKIVNFYDHIEKQSDTSIVKQALLLSKQQQQQLQKTCYSSKLSDVLSHFSISINSSKSQIISKFTKKYSEFWKNELHYSEKLDFFKFYKHDFKEESYLSIIKKFKHRQALTKFRISNHILLIETGRYQRPKIPRHERICRFCSSGEIENESHFILKCKLFEELRPDLTNNIIVSERYFLMKNDEEKLNILLNSKHVIPTSKYIYKSFEILKEKLSYNRK